MLASRTPLVAAALAVAVAACGGPTAGSAGRAGAATVVTDDWVLGQVARQVGGGSVDVVAPGPTIPAGAVAVSSPRSSAGFAAAAVGAPRHLEFSGDALVPGDLAAFAGRLAATLTSVAPAGASRWRDGLAAVQTQARSTAGDLETSLQSCPRRTLVTNSGELGGFAAIGDITARVVTPATAAADVRAAGGTVFAVQGADDTALRAAATAVGARVVTVGDLATAPAGAPPSLGWAGGIEDVLATVTRGLGCPLDQ